MDFPKLRQFIVEKYSEPEPDHVPGICEECDDEVWIDTNLRPAGMAETCEEHEPLCAFQPKSNH